jgi:hypothetical protein
MSDAITTDGAPIKHGTSSRTYTIARVWHNGCEILTTGPVAAEPVPDRCGNARWRRYKARHGILSRKLYDACARATLTMKDEGDAWDVVSEMMREMEGEGR